MQLRHFSLVDRALFGDELLRMGAATVSETINGVCQQISKHTVFADFGRSVQVHLSRLWGRGSAGARNNRLTTAIEGLVRDTLGPTPRGPMRRVSWRER